MPTLHNNHDILPSFLPHWTNTVNHSTVRHKLTSLAPTQLIYNTEQVTRSGMGGRRSSGNIEVFLGNLGAIIEMLIKFVHM